MERKHNHISTGLSTYWSTAQAKIIDSLDFCVTKGIKKAQFKTESFFDLSLEHSLLIINSITIIICGNNEYNRAYWPKNVLGNFWGMYLYKIPCHNYGQHQVLEILKSYKNINRKFFESTQMQHDSF